MTHLSEDQLYNYVFDHSPLADAESAHLLSCSHCQLQLVQIQKMFEQIQLRTQSLPTQQALARYEKLFVHLPQPPNKLETIVQRLYAQLVWDSRKQLSLQGVRNAALRNFRLVHTTEWVEVDVVLTPEQTNFNLEGELIPVQEDELILPALLQLQLPEQDKFYETETTEQGRFSFEGIVAGSYVLLITPTVGKRLEIEGLKIE